MANKKKKLILTIEGTVNQPKSFNSKTYIDDKLVNEKSMVITLDEFRALKRITDFFY
jgi:hypothetical protein